MSSRSAMRYVYLAATATLLLFLSITSTLAAGRTAVRGFNGMVSSSSAIASEVGVDILRAGGNSVDAAIATAFALAVTLPSAGNIGGGGFLVYHGVDGHATSFDFREKAPLAATNDMYLDTDGKVRNNSNHDGILAVGVPGTVAGLALAHERLGSLPWEQLVEPAIRLAREGFSLTFDLSGAFRRNMAEFEAYPGAVQVFTNNDGTPYEPGDTWIQADLADTLARIQKNGREGFYSGKTAQIFADYMAANDGIITLEDLAEYEAVEREPVRGTYRGYEIVGMAPPSSAGVAMVEMLNILEGYDLAEMGHNSAAALHVVTEAMRRAYADRANYLGDSDFNEDMPLARLTSKAYAEKLRATIDLNTASESDPALFASRYESPETTHFSIADKNGNMVSLTYTLEHGYGSKIVVDGAGFLLNNEMGDFNARPGITLDDGTIGTNPNIIRPEQRMLSSMSPTVVAIDGVPLFAIGTPGGRTIINTTMQVILNVIDHGMTIAEAVEAPRIHHQWLPNRTQMEQLGFSKDTRRIYESYGHTIYETDTIGQAMGVYRDRETGVFYGAADSRAADSGVAAF